MKNIFILCLYLASLNVHAQQIPLNSYGLPIVNSMTLYRSQIQADSTLQLVLIKDIAQDVRYATADNFTHTRLYPFPAVWLRQPAYQALQKVQALLKPMGLALKIFDGYRPYRITEKMWEIVPDDRYAADPKVGSGHNRGVAVDLTIISLKTGRELDMGTPFDDFTEKAHHNYADLSDEVQENRRLLRTLMEAYGFTALETEWWHYFLKDARRFPLMDLGLEELAKEF